MTYKYVLETVDRFSNYKKIKSDRLFFKRKLSLLVIAVLFCSLQTMTQTATLRYMSPNSYDISTATYAGVEFTVAGQEDTPTALAFNLDGSKMFVLGPDGDAVVEYNLGSPFDISTMVSYAGSGEEFSIAGEEDNPGGFTFNNDGSKMFVVGWTEEAVFEYNLGIPFDVSTAILGGQFIVGAGGLDGGQETQPRSVVFNNDGRKMFVVGSTDAAVVEYNLSTPFDVSTASYPGSGEEFPVTEERLPSGLVFNTDGSKMFVMGLQHRHVVAYNLVTPFDVSTASRADDTDEFSVNGQETNPQALVFNNDGSKMYVIGNSDGAVVEYDLVFNYPEATANDGSIDNSKPLLISLAGSETFALADGATLTSAHVTVGNVPAGLSPVLTIGNGQKEATLTFTGSATTHGIVDTVADLNFAFTNAAFTGGNAAGVIGSGAAAAHLPNVGIEFLAQNDPTHFIMTYNTANQGVTGGNSFRIPAVGGSYDVDIGNDGSFELTDETGSIDIDVTAHMDPTGMSYTAGTIQIAIRNAISGNGNFEQIQFNDANDHTKLISIDQWGSTIVWTSMNNAFRGCSNMDVLATDLPNLAAVTDFFEMFDSCSSLVGNATFSHWNVSRGINFRSMFSEADSFNQNIGAWDVSRGENFFNMFNAAVSFDQDIGAWDVSRGVNFGLMFAHANSFNQDIGSWDVSRGTSFAAMFNGADSFNQDIGNWNVSHGTDFSFMFQTAISFNQDIGTWDVSSGTDFQEMFQAATSFNQDIGAWDVSSGDNFSTMFWDAIIFDQDIGGWDVSGGVNFSDMFNGATRFNQDISGWDVSRGSVFFRMFDGATRFNQDISAWNVSRGTDFGLMFLDATAFNQDLGSWDVEAMTSGIEMFDNSGLSQANWDATLIGWESQNFTNSNVTIGATGLTYCTADAARTAMQGITFNFVGDVLECPAEYFIMTYNTEITGDTGSGMLTIPAVGGTFDVDIGNDGSFELTDETGSLDIDVTTHGYAAGTIQIAIRNARSGNGGFNQILFNNGNDATKLISIDQWGNTIAWTSMNAAFFGCENMDVLATDEPDLSAITSFIGMFNGCNSLIGTTEFDTWNVSQGTDFSFMFQGATAFNQDISGWNVSQGTDFSFMFDGATAFDQDLGDWDVGAMTTGASMFKSTAMSVANWDATLMGWHAQNFTNSNVNVGASGLGYCSARAQRQSMIDANIFNFQGDEQDCPIEPFIMTYNTEITGDTGSGMLTIPAVGGLYDVDIGNDGSFELTDITDLITIDVSAHNYAAGLIQVTIRNAISGNGAFEHIQFGSANDHTKLISIDQWGSSIAWTSMNTSFLGCSNMDVIATDVPDLAAVTDFLAMFTDCTSLIGNTEFKNWNVSSGVNFSNMFQSTTNFNQDISSWDVSRGTDFSFMFSFNRHFNQDISAWNVSRGILFNNMFNGATAFNQNIGSWDVSGGTDFSFIFQGATAFNQDIGDWDVSGGTDFSFMFHSATAFNQDISGWDVSHGSDFGNMFLDATAFNQDLGSWDVGAMTSGVSMFNSSAMSVANWDATLIGWESQNFTNSNVTVGATGLTYCTADAARTAMQGSTFTFIGDVRVCATDYFIMTYNTQASGDTDLNSLTIPASAGSTYDVDIGNDGSFELLSQTGSIPINVTAHGYSAGTIQVAIRNAASGGNFEQIQFNNGNDDTKLVSIDQWGSAIAWTSMNAAFQGASNMDVVATDAPNLAAVTDFSNMFRSCSSLIGIAAFNTWNVSSGIDFNSMFSGATAFNQDIGAWNVSSGNNFENMFGNAAAFNQDIGDWDVSSGNQFTNMFSGATAFNQDLGDWDVDAMTSGGSMFDDTAISQSNWDATLTGWHDQTFTPNNPVVSVGAAGLIYCDADAARTAMQGITFNFVGDVLECPAEYFIITYNTANAGQTNGDSFRIPAVGGLYDVDIGNDGSFELTDETGSVDIDVTTHGYAAGTIQVAIRNARPGNGGFKQILFNNGNDATKLTSIDQWGSAIAWTSMDNAFSGASNMDVPATDTPNLGAVTSFSAMFGDCTSLTGTVAFNTWNVSSVTDFSAMFQSATAFNQDISGWNVSSGENFSFMFLSAEAFNQDIGSWDVSGGTNFSFMFQNATAFNQDISGWNVSSGTNFRGMFESANANAFNQNIGSWNVSRGTDFSNMFSGASTFNQDIGDWDVSRGTDFTKIFDRASSFNQDLGGWDVGAMSISGGANMFFRTGMSVANWDATLIGWHDQNFAAKVLPVNVGSSLIYCDAKTQRQSMIDDGIFNFQGDMQGCPTEHFIMTYDTEVTGDTGSGMLTIPAVGGLYDVDVNNDGTFELALRDQTGAITIDVTASANGSHNAGLIQIAIRNARSGNGTFEHIQFNHGNDDTKLISIDQWGSAIAWTSMNAAFAGCENMDVKATDVPNLNAVTNFSAMFEGCSSLKGNTKFNDWDVSHGTDFSNMFVLATNFDQDLGDWDVSRGTSFASMFNTASTFNQDISGWDVSHGTNFSFMFSDATAFNQDIGIWDVSGGTDFSFMFQDATAFNQDIGIWDVSGGTDFSFMFHSATAFNQNIGIWDVSSGNTFSSMFNGATRFNQDLGSWDVGAMNAGTEMFDNSGVSLINWDATLIGWEGQNFTNANIPLGAAGLTYCTADAARTAMQGTTFSFVGDVLDCSDSYLIMTYNTEITGAATGSGMLTIPAVGGLYDVDIGNDGTFELTDNTDLITIDVTAHNYAAGSIQVAIRNAISGNGNFEHIQFDNGLNNGNDATKLTSIDQWGSHIAWTSMSRAFSRCSNMDVLATDVPNLAAVTNFSNMFSLCSSLMGNNTFNAWDVSRGTDFNEMFSQASIFNQDIGSWDVSSGTNFADMFALATNFNQDIGAWDVSQGTNFANMFVLAPNFDQDLGDWDVGRGTKFASMFNGATRFNQDISAWNVSSGTDFSWMFRNATSFNQDLGRWDVDAMTNGASMFSFSGMSLASWNATLIGWEAQGFAAHNPVVNVGASGLTYCIADAARTAMETANIFDFTGDVLDCSETYFIMTYDTEITGAATGTGMLTVPAVGGLYDVDIGNDGTFELTDNTDLITIDVTAHNYAAGTIQVAIRNAISGNGNFEHIQFDNGNDDTKLISIDQWGSSIAWTSMEDAFFGCSNMDVVATDVPNLAAVTTFFDMFLGCNSLIGTTEFDNWNVSSGINFSDMFQSATNFNQDISGWDVSSGVDFSNMFARASSFNQDISGWDVSNGIYFFSVFSGATAFNQNIGSWDVSGGADFRNMFLNASSFNQDLGSWNVGAMIHGTGMFNNSGLSQTNWDATLIGWEGQSFTNANIRVGAAGLTYCNADAARTAMQGTFNFVGDVRVCATDYFIMTYNTANAGETNGDSFRIPAVGGMYDVDIGNDGNFELTDQTGSIDIDVTTYTDPMGTSYAAGVIPVAIRNAISGNGGFEQIKFNHGNDDTKLISIDQWGSTIAWTSMNAAFAGCENMDVIATDVPNLNAVTNFSAMFEGCTSLTGNSKFNDWDVSHGTDFSNMFVLAPNFDQDLVDWDVSRGTSFASMFNTASAFNQDISGWDVSHGTNFSFMFSDATAFNQDIGIWDVSRGTDFSFMFQDATAFNQDIGTWDVSSGNFLFNMFDGATRFNQDISGWDVSHGTAFFGMFWNAISFDQDISGWDVSSGTDFNQMFRNATDFNQDISAWDVSSGTDFFGMFEGATRFNQDIGGWNVSRVTDFSNMFLDATAFNQDLGSWDVGAMTTGTGMFDNSGLSQANWDATLTGWHAQNFTHTNITVGAAGLTYCTADAARTAMQGITFNFVGDVLDCSEAYFIMTYDTEILGGTNTSTGMLTIPVVGGLYDVDIGNDGSFELTDNTDLITIDVTAHHYAAGIIQVVIRNAISGNGTFEHIQFNNANDHTKLISIDQWGGSIAWVSMENAFFGCSNMDVLASDIPNLETVTNFDSMFRIASDFNQDIGAWDVSNGISFSFMFAQASSFDQDISGWNVSSGIDFSWMFGGASLFNQNIGIWNVSNGTDFSGMFGIARHFNQDLGAWDVSRGVNFSDMFRSASAFNQDISGWDVSHGEGFSFMFQSATAFNHDISDWDVSHGTDFSSMFLEATAFNQDLGSWDVGAMTNGTEMFDNSGLSQTNWDATLIGWEAQSFSNAHITVGAAGLTYCAADEARTALETAGVFDFVGDVACVADPTNMNTTLLASSTSIVADGTSNATITLTLSDANGELLPISGGIAIFQTTGGALLSDVTDHGDGTYTATITNTVAEQVTISAILAGEMVTDTIVINFTSDSALSVDDDAFRGHKIYPNPVENILNVETNNSIIKGYELYNLLQQQVGGAWLDSNPDSIFQIDVSNLSEGLYFLKLHSENEKIAIIKFLKK